MVVPTFHAVLGVLTCMLLSAALSFALPAAVSVAPDRAAAESTSTSRTYAPAPSHKMEAASWYNVSSWNNGTTGSGSDGKTASINGTSTVEGNEAIPIAAFYTQQITANNIAVAALTLYGWEYLSTLPDEVMLYRSRKLSSPHVILFALIRYGTIPALVLPAFSVWHDFRNNPKGCLEHQQLAICFVQLIVALILAHRTIAVWSRQRFVVLFFAIAVPAQFAVSFALLWYSTESLLPNGACMTTPNRNGIDTMPWFYLVAMCYDLSAICLSTYKLWEYGNLGRPNEKSIRDEKSTSASSTTRSQQRRSGQLRQAAAKPVTAMQRLRARWKNLTPLIDTLLRSGLVYITVSMLFNATCFALLYVNQLHAHSLIVLYSPLMCILLQRMLLIDTQAIWGRNGGRDVTGSRERQLVDRVMQQARHSWEGDDNGGTLSQAGGIVPSSSVGGGTKKEPVLGSDDSSGGPSSGPSDFVSDVGNSSSELRKPDACHPLGRPTRAAVDRPESRNLSLHEALESFEYAICAEDGIDVETAPDAPASNQRESHSLPPSAFTHARRASEPVRQEDHALALRMAGFD